jgi:heme oxygenase
MRRLLSGELHEAGYRRLLAAQWGLFRDWEAERAEWLEGAVRRAGWGYVSRADRLAWDLFGRPIAAEAAPTGDSKASRAEDTSAAEDPSGAPELCVGAASAAKNPTHWGELYVIEGSALGARLIVKHLRQRFPTLPHAFYAIGEHTKQPWHRFQAILDTVLVNDEARRAAVNGALAMFARFQQTLQDDPRHG